MHLKTNAEHVLSSSTLFSSVPGLDAVLEVVQNAAADGSTAAGTELLRGLAKLLGRCKEGPHGRVGADQAALVALRALVHVNRGHVDGNASLLILAGAQWHAAAWNEGADRQGVAIQVVAMALDLLCKLFGAQVHDSPWPLGLRAAAL